MNTIEALQYLKDNPNTTLVKYEDDNGYRIEMSIDEGLRDFDDSLFVNLIKIADSGESQLVHFEEWVELGNEWEVSKEARYYVKFKIPNSLELLLSDNVYLNKNNYSGRFTLDSTEPSSAYQISFTRDEIEEFGIEHPEVRREDLEFIEVVE